MGNRSCFVAARSAALLLVGLVSACSGSEGGTAPEAVGSRQQAICTGIGQPCTMPDGCTGTWVCNDGFKECSYNNPGSRPCTTCPGGRQACADTGPYGPCQWTSPQACTNTCGTGTQTCSDGVYGACNVAPKQQACGVGACAGTQTCSNGAWGPCTNCPVSFPCTNGNSCGTTGTITCSACQPTTSTCPVQEACNNCDDNLDGNVDEGLHCSCGL
jgi:hypothetical protein